MKKNEDITELLQLNKRLMDQMEQQLQMTAAVTKTNEKIITQVERLTERISELENDIHGDDIYLQ
jgi:hypothetical protein